jgi:aspartyl-tRNA(Asn)/glutamyl-tRNA(Gln) amidotransferase subunit A
VTNEDIGFTPATVLAAQIQSRQISPVEVMRAVLAQIERNEPRINAFAHLEPETAMAHARLAEAALLSGQPIGRLHGLPVTIKDLAPTRDMPTQYGSQSMAGFRPDFETPFVTRLREAGAIVIGKTTTSEFGWSGVSRSPLTGITHNPWKHGYSAGASSAGAGAAAAAGYGPLHQGSDGAGSIRMPSHFCGVFGLKPSYGRVPAFPQGGGDYTSHSGPMTRTVADSALMLEVMSGPHPLDHTSLDAAPAPYLARLGEGIRGKRIAYSRDLGHARVDPEIAALVEKAVAKFTELGAVVEEATPPWASEGPELVRAFWSAHLVRLVPKLEAFESRMDPGLVACIKAGQAVEIGDYMRKRERKMNYIAAMQLWFADFDFLLTPSASVAAFPAELLMPAHWPQHEWDWVSWAEFSYPFNFSGNPAASVPCGFTAAGLPVGLQIVGRLHDDLGVLQASAAFEAVAPWADQRPNLS